MGKKAVERRKKKSKRVEKCLIGGADAGERLGRHRVNRLILCHTQRIFIADKSLGVQLE